MNLPSPSGYWTKSARAITHGYVQMRHCLRRTRDKATWVGSVWERLTPPGSFPGTEFQRSSLVTSTGESYRSLGRAATPSTSGSLEASLILLLILQGRRVSGWRGRLSGLRKHRLSPTESNGLSYQWLGIVLPRASCSDLTVLTLTEKSEHRSE